MHTAFDEIRTENIEEISSKARIFEHKKTRAKVLCLESRDENKVFGLAFRTPPKDSTGIAHILEHSVLCGSKEYPVKEPFVELLKGSLKTFLNAFTFPDKTMYPVASANEQDLINMAHVYLDAVFFPNLTEYTLMQEGWHLEPDEKGKFAYKGVVYNEMKGAYSSPDGLLSEYTQQSLFPDNTYGLDSGGDPAVIPSLTFDQFMSFHKTYYHPSNCYAFFTGDGDISARLELLDSYFSQFDYLEVDSAIGEQPRRNAPARVEEKYAATDQDAKAYATVNFLLQETTDAESWLNWQVLEYILVGMPSSPLRKALMDSGLGEDLAGVGLEQDLKYMYFSTGLKGIDLKDADKVLDVVLDTCRDMAENGIDPEDVAAAMNSIEFDLRENNTGSFPKGLSLVISAMSTWLYSDDPLLTLAFEAPLSKLKQRLESGEKVFESMLKADILDNSHQSLVVLTPDMDLSGVKEKQEAGRVEQAISGLDQSGLDRITNDAKKLEELQTREDKPEDLAKIPRLTLSDLPKENTLIPKDQVAGDPLCLVHGLDTSGIVYLDMGFDVKNLDQDLIPYLPIFGRCLLEMGTTDEDFAALSRRISKFTGGIGSHATAMTPKDSKGVDAYLFFRGKATREKSAHLLDILSDVYTKTVFTDKERLRQIVQKRKAGLERSLIPSGHSVVATRLGSSLSLAGMVQERLGGVSALFFARELLSRIDTDFDSVVKDLESIRDQVIKQPGMVINITADEDFTADFAAKAMGSVSALSTLAVPDAAWSLDKRPMSEALTMPAEVNYVAKGINLYDHGYEFSGSDHVVTGFLRNSYLWDRVRVRGGAYGGFVSFNRLSGTMCFLSYRDPNTKKTIEAYDQASDFLNELSLDQAELEKSVIGAIGGIDAYQLPDAKGFTSLSNHLTRQTDEYLQTIREQVLATKTGDFKKFARATDMVRDHGRVCILGPAQAVEASGMDMDITKVL